VCIHLQTNMGASGNANASIKFKFFIHGYSWIRVIFVYMGYCYNNEIKQLNKKIKNKNNYDCRTNHLWGLLVSIQMQCQFLIKLLNKRKIKLYKHNPWVNHFVNEYYMITSIFGCDCFSLDFNIIWWFNEFYLWINTNNNESEFNK
jgi:hypothetical protein